MPRRFPYLHCLRQGLDCRFERYGRIFLMCTEAWGPWIISAGRWKKKHRYSRDVWYEGARNLVNFVIIHFDLRVVILWSADTACGGKTHAAGLQDFDDTET